MKKFILSVFLPLLFFLYALFPLASVTTYAASVAEGNVGNYACILTNNVFFYSTRDEKRGLFLLPKTYYVKILESSPDFCKIEYLYDDAHVKKLVGYARTSDLAFVDYVPERPYLYYLFDVQYRLDETVSDGDGFLNEITVTCAYYGDYNVGSETYCYVLRGDSFGYIPKPVGVRYEENPEYAERNKTESEDSSSEEKSAAITSSSPAQIAILVALCLLVPVLAALILKPPRRPPYETDEP